MKLLFDRLTRHVAMSQKWHRCAQMFQTKLKEETFLYLSDFKASGRPYFHFLVTDEDGIEQYKPHSTATNMVAMAKHINGQKTILITLQSP